MLSNGQLKMEYANRARELMDLLFSDRSRTGGQVAQLVDEYARFIDKSDGVGGYVTGWAELDQYMWNYHPRTTTDHKGTFYTNPASATNRGGTWTRTLSTADFDGMVQYVIDFMTDTDPNSWAVNDGDQRGYGFNYLEFEATDALIPNRPVVSYTGQAGFASNLLAFSTTAFSDPDGSAFSAMEWRIGEISNPGTAGFDPNAPWKYEIDTVWESGELSTFGGVINIPAGVVEAGHTYRLRVRMKDATGRWSRWSDVAAGQTEFVAGAVIGSLQPGLRITELHYHPGHNPALLDDEDQEFIELQNTGSQEINLQGVQITQFTATPYVFGNINLAAGAYIVVARNPAIFTQVYGGGINLAPEGYGTANLSNGGERIMLIGSLGDTLQDFTYDDVSPWPLSPDGAGPSLEIINPLGDATDPTNWKASAAVGGTPGTRFVAGDANGDLIVDAADFDVWFGHVGDTTAAGPSAGDLNFTGIVDAADFDVWFANIGAPPAPVIASSVLIPSIAGMTLVSAFASDPSGPSVLLTPAGSSETASVVVPEPMVGSRSAAARVPAVAVGVGQRSAGDRRVVGLAEAGVVPCIELPDAPRRSAGLRTLRALRRTLDAVWESMLG